MMASQVSHSGSTDRVRALPNNIYVVSTAAGDVLVNCPPETLKYLLFEGLKPPTIVLLPPDITPGEQLGSSGFVRQGINYASVEFMIYSGFFGQGGRKARLITVTQQQALRLHAVLEESVSGPQDMLHYGEFGWLQRECSAVSYFPPLGRAPLVDDMAEIVSLEAGGGELGAAHISLEDGFFVFREGGSEVARVTTQTEQVALPLRLAPPRPLSRQELTLQFIGGSDGFDPAGITTCFLAYLGTTVQTQATLFDSAAYICARLGNLGLSTSQISEVVISHLHEDHVAGLPELVLMGSHRVRLVTSDIIYQSLLRMLSALFGLPESDVAALFDYYPLNPGEPLELSGRRFESIYAVHSIPTIAVRVNQLCYSGDMRYDEAWFAELVQEGVLSDERRRELERFAEGASILVQDVGGGPIHSTITPALLEALTAKSSRLVLAHTSKHLLPADRPDLAERVEFAESGHVVAVGQELTFGSDSEPVETISACPLFARLPITDRIALAQQALITNWPDGAVIMREAEPSDGYTYIVHSGLVEFWQGEQQVRVLGRGNSIGERGALQNMPRTGTMYARGPVQLLRIDQATFRPIADRLGLIDAFTRADWLWHHSELGNLPWASLLDVALEFQPRRFAAGEQLFAQGEIGDEGYLLVEGQVLISATSGDIFEERATSGDFFGIRAALYGTLRRAAALTESDGEIWCLSRSALQRLNLLYPNILLHLRAIETQRTRKHGEG
jgi:CRP-like cAMP-binding protein/ribonuclease BN (tRNA processing enzyme)